MIRDRLRDEQPDGAVERLMFWTALFSDLGRTAAFERLEQIVTTTNLVRYSGPLAILGGLLWAGAMAIVALSTNGIDSIEPVFLIASVAIAGCLIAIAAQGGFATPKLALSGALFGGFGAVCFLLGVLTGAWWFIIAGVYGLLVGSCLSGLGMLNLQRVQRWSPGALIASSGLMFMMNDTNQLVWFGVPFGIAWIALGYVLSTQSHDRMMLAP